MSIYDGRWESAIVVPAGVTVTATNSGGGPTSVSITAGSYASPTALLAHVVARLNAVRTPATWTGSLSVGTSGTGQCSINWTGAGTYTLAWTSTELRDILGFSASSGPVTQGVATVGPSQARGLWFPDCPIAMDGNPRSAPRRSDRRTVVTPTGIAYTHVGSTFYQLRNLRYSHVPRARVWAADAVLANASFETFYLETQLGLSSTWFVPGSKCQVYDSGVLVGINGNSGAGLAGWQMAQPRELDEITNSVEQWTGFGTIMLGNLVSDG